MAFTVTCAELPILMRQLRAVDRNLANEVKRDIRKAEQPAKRAMEAAAVGAGMMKASRAVKLSNRYGGKSASLGLKVDAGIAPNARPLDKPNDGDFNRHPVFGSRNWVEQPARRFFDRGADEGFKVCEKEMGEALDAVVAALARG